MERLVIILSTASLLQICAAFTCEIDTSLYNSCKDQKKCKFVPASPGTPAVPRDEFYCIPSASYSGNQTLIAACRKGGVVFSEIDCKKRDVHCGASKFKSRSNAHPYKPAKCVPKICADYNEETCHTNSSCLFRPETTGTSGKYRCACPSCDTSAQKRACARASSNYCGQPYLGGDRCLTVVVEAPIPKKLRAEEH